MLAEAAVTQKYKGRLVELQVYKHGTELSITQLWLFSGKLGDCPWSSGLFTEKKRYLKQPNKPKKTTGASAPWFS